MTSPNLTNCLLHLSFKTFVSPCVPFLWRMISLKSSNILEMPFYLQPYGLSITKSVHLSPKHPSPPALSPLPRAHPLSGHHHLSFRFAARALQWGPLTVKSKSLSMGHKFLYGLVLFIFLSASSSPCQRSAKQDSFFWTDHVLWHFHLHLPLPRTIFSPFPSFASLTPNLWASY